MTSWGGPHQPQRGSSFPSQDPHAAGAIPARDAAVNTTPSLGTATPSAIWDADRAVSLAKGQTHRTGASGKMPGAASQEGGQKEKEQKELQPTKEGGKGAGKPENNYESLERGGRGSHHVYRPIVPAKPGGRSLQPHPHTCPLPPDVTRSQPSEVCAVQMIGFGPPSATQPMTRNEADIIELHSDLIKPRLGWGEGVDDRDPKEAATTKKKKNKPSGKEEKQKKKEKKKKKKKEQNLKENEREESGCDLTTTPKPAAKAPPTQLNNENIPNTHFAIACMVALCFNLPLGVLAMYLSLRAVRAFQEGRQKLGQRRSRWSIIVSLLGITVTTLIVSSVVFYIATKGHKSLGRARAYGTKTSINL